MSILDTVRAAPGPEEVRRLNLGSLLQYVHLHGATSRSELTSRLGLNRSTIGTLTAELTTAGLVSEAVPRETGRAGRPSLVVRPATAVHAYALSIETGRLSAARVGLGGRILDRRDAVRPPGMRILDAVQPLAEFVGDMRAVVADDGRAVGTGVAVAGGARWADEVSAALGAALGDAGRLTVGDHADVSALAEHSRGAAVGCDSVIYLHGDAGISAGIITAGHRMAGYGGDIGHMVVNPYGRECGCGSAGCWETEIGARALLDHAGRPGQTVRAVADAALRGDSQARSAVRRAGEWIGFGVGNLATVFNPEAVILGGTLRDVHRVAADQIRARMTAVASPASRAHLRLHTPALADAALIGAAELAFARLLDDPLLD